MRLTEKLESPDKPSYVESYWTNGQFDLPAHNRTSFVMTKTASWIAVVDDDPSILKALTRLLRTQAFEAKTYGSAREFLAALPAGLPKCLIVDLQMPEMSGLDLLQHLTRNGIDIPTIVITAHNEVGARERCRSAGASAFLSKPLQDISLFAAIADANERGR